MLNKIFFGLLLFVPLTAVIHYLHVSPILVFFISALAIIPLAKFIGEATEELSVHVGSALGGLLNATFGNATELIISIFAMKAGLLEVVKASITGSIIGNLLLVLGMAIFFGGLTFKKQKVNRTASLASASTLLLAVIALIIPAIFLQTAPEVGNKIIENLSIAVAILMIGVYIASLFFILKTHKHLYTEEVGKFKPNWSIQKSAFVLLTATLAVAWMSEILVGSIEPLVKSLGWSELFIGVIFVAIIGNAAEHTSAITMAIKNKMDLALQISIGSATQIVMFVMPLLVLISLMFKTQMNLVFNTFELVVILLSVMIANLVIEDGETNWFEGLQLLVAYAIIAVAFFFHP
ncbi:MAG: calcium/proton exchanger [Parcubacteria group bacterium]|nr:calcium/proton exchanger [Parcubacteria group bacterium]